MWPFRRKKSDFDPLLKWATEQYSYHYNPVLPDPPLPEPWRQSKAAQQHRVYLLDKHFLLLFADASQISNNRIRVPDKIQFLKESIAQIGIKEPGIVVIDENGKFRYHDGYHRLTAILELDKVTHMPVYLRRSSNRIKGFGLDFGSQVEVILDAMSAD